MSLLFDQNLSPRLVSLLSSDYPRCAHVRSLGLVAADDQVVWQYAQANGFVIVSKDADFQHRALLYGAPPKVIWLRIGNGPTQAAVDLLQFRKADIAAFTDDPAAAL